MFSKTGVSPLKSSSFSETRPGAETWKIQSEQQQVMLKCLREFEEILQTQM
jgi:hypothetical protein